MMEVYAYTYVRITGKLVEEERHDGWYYWKKRMTILDVMERFE